MVGPRPRRQQGRGAVTVTSQWLVRRPWRPRWLAAAGVARLSLVACGGQSAGSHASATPSASPSSGFPRGTVVIKLPPTTNSSFKGAFELRSTASGVWVSDGLFSIDPVTNAVSPGLDTSHGYDAQYVATDTNSIWGSDYTQNSVRRYDTTTGKLIASIAIPTAEGIVSAYGATWVVSHHDGNLYRLDPSTNHVTAHAQLSLPGDGGLQGIASGLGSIWVGGGVAQSVWQVDPTTMRITEQVEMPSGLESCGDLAVSTHDVWTTERLDSSHILRVDPATQSVKLLPRAGSRHDPQRRRRFGLVRQWGRSDQPAPEAGGAHPARGGHDSATSPPARKRDPRAAVSLPSVRCGSALSIRMRCSASP